MKFAFTNTVSTTAATKVAKSALENSTLNMNALEAKNGRIHELDSLSTQGVAESNARNEQTKISLSLANGATQDSPSLAEGARGWVSLRGEAEAIHDKSRHTERSEVSLLQGEIINAESLMGGGITLIP